MRRPATLALAVAFLLGAHAQPGLRAAEEQQQQPFAIEYYYKVKSA